jgi:hypothetical protein
MFRAPAEDDVLTRAAKVLCYFNLENELKNNALTIKGSGDGLIFVADGDGLFDRLMAQTKEQPEMKTAITKVVTYDSHEVAYSRIEICPVRVKREDLARLKLDEVKGNLDYAKTLIIEHLSQPGVRSTPGRFL